MQLMTEISVQQYGNWVGLDLRLEEARNFFSKIVA